MLKMYSVQLQRKLTPNFNGDIPHFCTNSKSQDVEKERPAEEYNN